MGCNYFWSIKLNFLHLPNFRIYLCDNTKLQKCRNSIAKRIIYILKISSSKPYLTTNSLFIYVFCNSFEHEIILSLLQIKIKQFHIHRCKSTKNQWSNFGLIEETMGVSCILIAVYLMKVLLYKQKMFLCTFKEELAPFFVEEDTNCYERSWHLPIFFSNSTLWRPRSANPMLSQANFCNANLFNEKSLVGFQQARREA